jgi:hypothetical protein
VETFIKTYDNFLDPDDLIKIKDLMVSDEGNFQWYFSPCKVTDGDGIPQFYHVFYDNCNINSDRFQYIEPLVKKINPVALVRIKSNITMKTSTILTSPLHSDILPEIYENRENVTLDNQRTGVFYLNTNNGYTYFESGERVDSVENRLVVFPSSKRHAGTTNTDADFRCVINLNWF